MGYTPTRGHTRSGEFHAVEVDKNGELLHDPVLLQRGGWGIDTLGTHMPGSGCVVFPYTWTSDDPENGPGKGYPKIEEDVSKRSQYLKFTALCPNDDAPRARPDGCNLQRSSLSEAAPRSSEDHAAECPSF